MKGRRVERDKYYSGLLAGRTSPFLLELEPTLFGCEVGDEGAGRFEPVRDGDQSVCSGGLDLVVDLVVGAIGQRLADDQGWPTAVRSQVKLLVEDLDDIGVVWQTSQVDWFLGDNERAVQFFQHV